jgi:putative Holliday junction resolvase
MSIDEKNLNISHYLGIDYGKSNVGLALADSETRMAFAHKTLKNDKNFINNLSEIIEKENVNKIVIGIPEYRGNAVNHVSIEAKKLGEFFKNTLKIEVFYQNEMFTTKMAQSNLIEKGMKGVNKFDDQESAKIILQEWMDNN